MQAPRIDLEVVPSFRNIESMLAKGARDIAKTLDKSLGAQLGDAMRSAGKSAERDSARAGQLLGKTFADNAMKNVNSAIAHISQTDRILAPLRKELVAISEIDISKGFDEKDFIARVERAYGALRKAQQDAQGKNAVSRFTDAGNAASALGQVKDIVEAARKRGFAAGDAYTDAYQSRLKAMDRAIPDLLTRQGSSGEQREIAAIKQRIQDATKLQIGDTVTRENNPLNLKVGVKISGEDLKREMGVLEGLLDQFTERSGTLELAVAADKARQQAVGFIEDVKTQQERATEDAARAYLKDWDAAVAEQARRERKVREDLARDHGSAIAEDVKRARRAQEQANADEQRLDLEREKAHEKYLADLERLDEQNRQLRGRATRREIEDRARELRQARDEQAREEEKARQQAQRDAERADAELARAKQKAAEEAQRIFRQSTAGEVQQRAGRAAERIVDLPVHLRANDIDREMAAIRARVAALGDLQIGIDVDVEDFATQIQAEFERLRKIARNQRIDMEVRVDAARAATELGGILVLLNRIDGDKAEVTVDTDGAAAGLLDIAQKLTLNLGRMGALVALGASIGTAIVPAAAAAAASIGAIGTAALGAGSGVGVMMLAFSGIGDAVKALGQFADNQAKSNTSLARSSNQVEAAEQQIVSAEMALANTRRNNARAAVKASQAVQGAIEDQRDAVVDVARSNRDAVQKVADSQRDLTAAARDDLAARSRLNEAYLQARRALAELNSQLRGNGLDQRQATLDIAAAKAELDKMLLNPRATVAEREQADITYQQRLLQMDDLKRKGAQLSDEQDKQFREGIDQSSQVKKAREDISKAEERRLAAQRSRARAQEDLVRTQLDGSRKLRDADRKVADARAAAADQQKDAAYAEFSAVQSLISARRALENATNRDAVAGGAQLDNLNTAMAKLSPTAQAFARYVFGLRDAFYALRAAADPVLAGLQKAMTSLLGETSKQAKVKLAPLFDFVHRVATALGGIFVQFANTLKGPTFSRFFAYVSDTAVPTLQLLYQMFENITVGVLNLFLAFAPLTGDVNNSLLGLTESFRKWSETLETNQGFQRLIQYIRDSWPQVGGLLKEFVKAIASLVIAAAPVGTVVVKIFTKLFEWMNKIPEKVLITLVAGIAAAAAAIGAFAAATAIASLEIPGLIAGGVALLVVAFSALAGSSASVGDTLQLVWEKIKVGAVVAFDFLKRAIVALKPVFDDMVEAALAFYNDGLKPAWDASVAVVGSAVAAIRPYLSDIGGFFVKVGELAFYLYDKALLPAFKGIMVAVRTLFEVFRPVFETIGFLIGKVAGIFFWLLNRVVMPVVGGIVKLLVKVLTPVIQFLWKFVFKPILGLLGIAFNVLAALVKVAIGVITLVLKGLGALFVWLYEKAIKPVWDLLVKNVFRPMGEWISKHIGPTWKKALETLARHWDDFKKRIGAVIRIILHFGLNEGLLKAYNWLADKFNINPKNVKIPEPTGDWYTQASFATGGAVIGPGTATSDSIPARLSRGEHVLTAREVQAAGGHQAIYAWRKDLIRRRGEPYALGGAVGREIGDGFGDWLKKTGKSIGKKATDVFDSTVNFLKDPAGSLSSLAKGLFDKVPGRDTWIVQKLLTLPTKVLEALKNKVTGLFSAGGKAVDGTNSSGIFGASNALGGTGGMMKILRAVFPGLALNSGFRPGAITVTGNRSYHGLNRAVDLPPRRDVFEWIRKNYPNSRELIFTPMGMEQIKDGKSHIYSGAVARIHHNHVHWAYDKGGLLPDTRNMPGGTMQVFHGKRTPDKVLTDTQWQHMSVLAGKARESMAGGNTYNFPYRNSTLDYDELNRWSSRQDALNRVNRRNY